MEDISVYTDKNFFAANNKPRYSIMRSFKRARRPDFCLEFQAKFLYLFPRNHKNRHFNSSLFSGNP